MRIALVTRVYPTQRPGGLPFVVQDRARELARQGHDVHVITTDGAGTEDGLVEIHPGGEPRRYSRSFAEHCKAAVNRLKPDIIHLDSFDRDHRWWEGRRVSCTMHGFGFGAFLTRWNRYRLGLDPGLAIDPEALRAEATALREFHQVLAISEHEQWMLADCYGLRDVPLVHNPIAWDFFNRPTTKRPRDGYFLCVGNPGTSKNRLFERVASMVDDVRRCSDVPRTELPAVYDGAVALVLPTVWAQGYDLTVAEALARRRVVIASHTGSYARRESDHIHTFPPGDWVELRKLLARVGDLQKVPPGAASHHRPDEHVTSWLEAVT